MRPIAALLPLLLLASCEKRIPAKPAPPPPPPPKIGAFTPPPTGYAPPACALADVEDKTGQGLGPELTYHLGGLARASGRFNIVDKGAEYKLVATFHRFVATVVRTEKSQPTDLQVVTEVELQFVASAAGEILIHQRSSRARQCNLKSWDLRLTQGQPDDSSRARILRAVLDEALQSILSSLDEKFSKPK